jgi:stress response protein YsnF
MMENLDEAQAVVRELVSAGIRREDIGFMANEKQAVPGSAALNESEGGDNAAAGALAGAGAGAAIGGLGGLLLAAAPLAIPGIGPIIAAGPIAAALTGAGIGAVAGGLIGGLTRLGVPEEEAHYYAEGVRRGGILVTVAANDGASADKAVGVMRRHGAVDIDERAAQWKKQGWKGRFEAAVGEEERTIPVTEEELSVGKREVEQGRVRVESRVREEPVQKSVDLEEVRVGKQKSRKKQTVQDTVRKTEVDVQRGGQPHGTYKGPERRVNTTPWLGEERRRAA